MADKEEYWEKVKKKTKKSRKELKDHFTVIKHLVEEGNFVNDEDSVDDILEEIVQHSKQIASWKKLHTTARAPL